MQPEEDLARVYDAHAQALFSFLLNLTRNEADTFDLLQEVFIRLAEKPAILSKVSNVRSFLFRMAHHLAIDRFRSKNREQEGKDRFAASEICLFAPCGNPDETLFKESLDHALEQLPPEQRAVVFLKLWEGMTFDDVAKTLDISPNTAASRYRYGLDKLREILRPVYEQIQ